MTAAQTCADAPLSGLSNFPVLLTWRRFAALGVWLLLLAMPMGGWLRGSAAPSSAVQFSQTAVSARSRASRLTTETLDARITVLRKEAHRRAKRAANPIFRYRNSHKSLACLDTDETDDVDELSDETQSECLSENSERADLTLPHSRATVGRSPSGAPRFLTVSSLLDAAQTIAAQCSTPLRSPRAPPRSRILVCV